MSDSLLPHGLQHAKLPCPSPSPCSNSCPLSQWCHPTISFSVAPFSSCPQSFPASGFFPMSQLFTSGGQSNVASFSASVLPMNNQDWFPSWLMGLISLLFQGLSGIFSSTSAWKHQFFGSPLLYGPTLTFIHDYWKNHSFDYMDFCWQSDVSVSNTLSRFVIAFLQRSKCLLVLWLESLSAVILEPKKMKPDSFPFFPVCLQWSDGTGCHDVGFLNVEF